jgi:hypothetical protein
VTNRTVFISQQLKVPTVPNFITVDGKFVQPGNPGPLQELPKIDIKDLADGTLEAIADAWKIALLETAKERRNYKPQPTPR